MHLLHLNPLTGTACTRCCVRRTDLPGASHLHTPEVSFGTTVLHFHTVVLHSVTTKRHHANHMAVWYRLTTVFYHLMAMTNFHTTVLHFHTSTFNFHTAVLHFNTAPTRLCLAQEVPHTRSAGGHGNPMRPFALPSTCLVVETPVCVGKTPVWLSRKPKPALCYIQQQHKRPFIKPNSTLNQHSFMYGPYCAQNPAWCAWWWKLEAPPSFPQTAVSSTQTAGTWGSPSRVLPFLQETAVSLWHQKKRFCVGAWWWKLEAPLSFPQTAVSSTQTAVLVASLSRVLPFLQETAVSWCQTAVFLWHQSQWPFSGVSCARVSGVIRLFALPNALGGGN